MYISNRFDMYMISSSGVRANNEEENKELTIMPCIGRLRYKLEKLHVKRL